MYGYCTTHFVLALPIVGVSTTVCQVY